MISRRSLLQTAAAGTLLTSFRRPAAAKTHTYSEVEAKIARRDFRELTKEDLPTPSLVVDQDVLERNLRRMSGHLKQKSFNLRAHCKIHKSTDLAKRQIALGAIGICCATIAESELMVNAGIPGVLWTCQPAGRHKIGRVVSLSKRSPDFACVVDDPGIVDALDEAAATVRTKQRVAVDVNVGIDRQGVNDPDAALVLAQRVMGKKNLELIGLMGYSGAASHTSGWEKRREKSRNDLARLLESVHLCKKSGVPVGIVTGGSTGTYNIDSEIEGMTELQAGSYVFMDTGYTKIGGQDGGEVYGDFGVSLTMLTTVLSLRGPGRVAMDAGNKAILKVTDRVKGPRDIKISLGGAEYGILSWSDGGPDLKLGQRVELIVSNLDVSTNAFDRYYVAKGDNIVDVYPIMGRAGAVQR
ncbi:MAG: alanine racemase [Bryobacteraceae bacterium]